MTIWILLIALVIILLAFDLFVLHKKNEIKGNKTVAMETSFWISFAMLFSIVVYFIYKNGLVDNPTNLKPGGALTKYITGYLIELSLSVDNLFVIAMIFKSFRIPMKYQHRTLFWGIIGAVVFRGIMIWLGVWLINKIDWMTYVFGAFLLFTAIRMALKIGKEEDPEKSNFRERLSRYFRMSRELDGQKFFTIQNAKRVATPLFGALIMIELTDLLFAVDSIPAVIAVTSDPFIVFSSNIFAVLGLRSMYFFLANMLEKFHYLEYSIVAILLFVGVKLLLVHHYHFPEWFSLGFIAVALGIGIFVSLRSGKHSHETV